MGEQFGFGLRLASALPIPGALSVVAHDPPARLTITLAAPIAPPPAPGFSRDGDTLVYSHPSGVFRCDHDGVAISPAPAPDLADLGALLIANALPAVLWLRGAFMLHAATVSLPGLGTLALAGASGSGKSTLAAGLLASGAELIGDDSLALTRHGGAVIAAGLPGGWFDGPADSAARRLRAIAPQSARGSAPLTAIIVLDRASPGAPALTRLAPLAALEQVLAQRHRPQVPHLLGRRGAVLQQAAALAAQIPVFAWRRGRDRGTPDLTQAGQLMRALTQGWNAA